MVKLSNHQYRISLLRVRPGTEDQILEEWLRRVASQAGEPTDVGVFMALGPCDLVLIRSAETEAKPALHVGRLPHILLAKEIDCYTWAAEHPLSQVLNKPLCSFVFVRSNPDGLLGDGLCDVEIELKLAEYFGTGNAEQDTAWHLLGTYGRSSGVLLVGAQHVQDLFSKTRELIARCSSILPDVRVPLVRDTVTLTGVCWPASDGGLAGMRRQYPFSEESEELFRSAVANIDIGCRAADVFTLGWDAQEFWDEKIRNEGRAGATPTAVAVSFGRADLHLRFPVLCYKGFGALVADLHQFRKAFSGALLSTESRIEFPMKRETMGPPAGYIDLPSREVLSLSVAPELASEIVRIHPEAPAILQSIFGYSQRLQDDGGEAIRDMVPFYAEIRNRAGRIAEQRRTTEESIEDDLRELYALLEQGQIGQIQRMDTYDLSRPSGTDLGPFRTGIGRLLWAAQAIPAHVLGTLLSQPWRGFVVGGRLKDAFATRPPVMNIPAESLTHPERWWVLTHEAMHDYVSRWRSLDFYDEMWMSAFSAGGFPAVNEVVHSYCRLLAVECLCDALEYLSLGALSWKDHQRVAWSYALECLRTALDEEEFLEEHLIRTMFAMRCDLDMTRMDAEDLMERFYADVILYLRDREWDIGTFERTWKNEEWLSRVKNAVRAFRPCAEWLLEHNPFDATMRQQRVAWSRSTYPACCVKIGNGELVEPDELQHPDLLVWLLRKTHLNSDLSPKGANAVILSLLWFYAEHFAELVIPGEWAR